MQWDLDVVGYLPRAQPQFRFLPVATNYFTKWVQTVPLSDVTGWQIVKFLRRNIVSLRTSPIPSSLTTGPTLWACRWRALLQLQDHPPILHSLLSIRQQPGWDQQSHYPRQSMQEPWQSKRQVGGETFRGTMGLQDYQARPKGRNPVLIGLRDGSYHPFWHLYAHTSHNKDWPKSECNSTRSRQRSI